MVYGSAYNSIISGNSATTSNDIYLINATNSCSHDFIHGVAGNTTNAPLFIGAGNYRLATSSACINAGSNAYVSNASDLGGNPRIAEGIADMGVYESGFDGCFITNCIPSVSGMTIDWTAFPMWKSSVMYSTNLATMPFTNLSSSLAYPQNSYTDLVNGAENECFYRVGISP